MKKRTSKKNCQSTTCGFTCISTLDICRINLGRNIKEKVRALISKIKQYLPKSDIQYRNEEKRIITTTSAETVKKGIKIANQFGLSKKIKEANNARKSALEKFYQKESQRLGISIDSPDFHLKRRAMDKIDKAVLNYYRDESDKNMLEINKMREISPAAKVMQDFRQHLISIKNAKVDISTINISSELGKYKSVIKEFYQLTGHTPPKDLSIGTNNSDNSYYNSGTNTVIIANRKLNKIESQLYHELGHSVEHTSPNLKKVNLDYLKTNSSGKKELIKGYAQEFSGYNGKFINPYMGRVYKDGDTEVLSVGLEHFAKNSSMVKLYEEDPRTFSLILGQLDNI